MVDKALHRTLNIKQHKPDKNRETWKPQPKLQHRTKSVNTGYKTK